MEINTWRHPRRSSVWLSDLRATSTITNQASIKKLRCDENSLILFLTRSAGILTTNEALQRNTKKLFMKQKCLLVANLKRRITALALVESANSLLKPKNP